MIVLYDIVGPMLFAYVNICEECHILKCHSHYLPYHMAGMESKLDGILAVSFSITKFKYFSKYH